MINKNFNVLDTIIHPIADGYLASVVTCLEMVGAAAPLPVAGLPDLSLDSIESPDPDRYRRLFTRIGGLPWLWWSRLALSEAQLCAILNSPSNRLWVLRRDEQDVGICELDESTVSTTEITFFGAAPELVGTGAGRLMMNHAVKQAFARPITRLTVQTCTLDHPRALPFYLNTGFVITHRHVEIMPDPRLNGLLPRDSGPAGSGIVVAKA